MAKIQPQLENPLLWGSSQETQRPSASRAEPLKLCCCVLKLCAGHELHLLKADVRIQFCYPYSLTCVICFPCVLPSFTGQGSMSPPWEVVGVVGSREGLITEADIS